MGEITNETVTIDRESALGMVALGMAVARLAPALPELLELILEASPEDDEIEFALDALTALAS